MSAVFRTINRDTPMLMPASIQEWLPEQHLARFVVEIVEQLDLSEITSQYGGGGKHAYHPALLVALLFYGYATGSVLQPQAGASDLRFGGVPLHQRRPASGP